MNRWVITLFSITMILFGTGCSDKTFTPAGVQHEQNDASSLQSKDALTEDEYASKVILYRDQLMSHFEELGSRLHEADDTENTEAAIIDQIERMQQFLMEYGQLTPPTMYTENQEDIAASMKVLDDALSQLREGVQSGDTDMMNRSIERMQEGQDLWNYAYAKLQITIDMPVGDGTITTADLKDLDKHDGIDRDSVLLGISPDGKELIGKWGIPNEDAVGVNIVLKENGDYEGYANGQYPDQSNILKGTWSYDHITRTLHFAHEVKYQDGVPTTDNFREFMTMEVQYFKDGVIQLRDIDTLATFRYTKAE